MTEAEFSALKAGDLVKLWNPKTCRSSSWDGPDTVVEVSAERAKLQLPGGIVSRGRTNLRSYTAKDQERAASRGAFNAARSRFFAALVDVTHGRRLRPDVTIAELDAATAVLTALVLGPRKDTELKS